MDITRTTTWKQLARHAKGMRKENMRTLFEEDPGRIEKYLVSAAGLHLDYSRNLINDATLHLLADLAGKTDLTDHAQQMYDGEAVNETEHRAALHTLLRSSRTRESSQPAWQEEVTRTLARMESISERIRGGKWLGYSGQRIRHIIHIGIGGSYLGPKMVAEALASRASTELRASWVANVDGQHIHQVLSRSDPAETLIVVASKTFTTPETMANARTARQWLCGAMPEQDLHRHQIAVTGNPEAARALGIDGDNILGLPDWVGGRYSLWSAVGITNAITLGMETFRELLAGAEAMDRHFLDAPLTENLPVLLALVGLWYHSFFDAASHAIIPYAHDLRLLPAHLQQLDMESNGKTVTIDGKPVNWKTGPIVWGGEGTNGQHAFHQLLHQGNHFVSIDFILPLTAAHPLQEHHDLLVANCLAQSQVLMQGRDSDRIVAELEAAGMSGEDARQLAPHKVMPGNRPSNTILAERFDPRTLGALIAMYEHKVFCQAMIWQINPFDQWGVESGKNLAQGIYRQITGEGGEGQQDSVTQRLVRLYQTHR